MRGFTLLELLVAIALLAIITAIAAPSLAETLGRARASSALQKLATSLQLARTTAVLHSRSTVVCKSHNGYECNATGDWDQGWIVFEDLNADGDCGLASAAGLCADGGRLLHLENSSQPSSIKLVGNNNIKNAVRFNPQGKVSGTNGTFTACRLSGNEILGGLVVSTPGRLRKAEAGDSMRCD